MLLMPCNSCLFSWQSISKGVACTLDLFNVRHFWEAHGSLFLRLIIVLSSELSKKLVHLGSRMDAGGGVTDGINLLTSKAEGERLM